MSPLEEPEFTTIPQASKILGIGPRQIRRACREGEIAVFQIGDWPRVRLEDVRRWVGAQRVPATPHAKTVVDEILRRETRGGP